MQAEQPIRLQVTGWRRGFASLWAKEMGEWWRTRKWLVHLLVWVISLNGILAMVSAATKAHPGTESLLQTQVDLLVKLGSVLTAIGVLVVMQGSMIGERQSGTAAWILSKPVSRAAMILAKFGANALSYIALAVLLPSAIAYGQIRFYGSVSLGAYLGLVGILTVHTLFYLTLTLMLGTYFNTRGPVLGGGMATLFLGSLVLGLLPQSAWFTPYGLPEVALGLFGSAPLPILAWLPVAATLLWSALFLVMATRCFNREEL